ncbi:VOC family protein [Streptomyces sp. NBC_01477]|uniref:VOC family protein n=1 Tax=Streptomyces sp. NBC_01477 TaxID=2976015 RepID=UPI002E35E9B4|nr:VOC family protein [Streptomyces sp. NBC_01477]
MLTNDYVPGAPNWVDLGSRDVTAAAAFYGDLFGWQFRQAGSEMGGYGMFQEDGATVAALGPLQEEHAQPAWTVYFHTPDADATTKAVEQAGGGVRFPPMAVADQGRLAGYTDPDGAEFAVWEPGTVVGLDKVGAGGLCWTELYTTDSARAKQFYGAVFDWDFEDMPLPGDAGSYVVASRSGGGQEGSHGGIMQLGTDVLPEGTSYWQPYFSVSDVDAAVDKAVAGGGAVLMPGTDLAGVGRLALLRDAEGAFFALLRAADPEAPADAGS